MIRVAILRLASLLLLTGLTGSAALADDAVDCANATAQQDVNYCLALSNQDIGKQLQAAYEAELANAEEGYAEVPENLAKVVDALKASQAAFMTYMKNQCASEGYMAFGGTLESQLYGECVMRLSKARIDELKALTEGLGN